MNSPAIIFRADAGSDSGMGHFMRCLAMAQMLGQEYDRSFALIEATDLMKQTLKANGISLIELKKDPDKYDSFADEIAKRNTQKKIIVLDGYPFTHTYQARLKKQGLPLVFIDDLVKPGQIADVIINPSDTISASDYLDSPNSKIYCGHGYAMLRKNFLDAASDFHRKTITSVSSVFVCFGAADPQNVSARVIHALEQLSTKSAVHLVTSKINRNLSSLTGSKEFVLHTDLEEDELCNLIKNCDLAICAPSTVSQECAAVGIPMLCLLTADNQLGIYDTLVKNGLCIGLGDANNISDATLSKRISEALENIPNLNEQVSLQKKWYDGKVAERIKKIIAEL